MGKIPLAMEVREEVVLREEVLVKSLVVGVKNPLKQQ
jgi:hypothetical protein